MAYPVIETTSGGDAAAPSTSEIVCTMPSGITSGDLLLCWAHMDKDRTWFWPGDWTEQFQKDYGVDIGSGSGVSTLGSKTAAGSDTLTLTRGGDDDEYAYHIMRISGWNSFEFTENGLAASTPSSPALTPTWGAKDTLWIAVSSVDGTSPFTAAPTNYSNFVGRNNQDANIGIADRELNATTDTPGTWTAGSNETWSLTIGIEPSGGAAAGSLIHNNSLNQFNHLLIR